MPKNKQKDMVNREEVTYTELKFSKSQQKQRILKTDQSTVISSEQQTNYMELKFHKSYLQQRKWFVRGKRKDHQSPSWKVIAGSLGVLFMVLMTIVGVLLANLFSAREEQKRKISIIPTLSSKNECSCDLCQDHWIGFGNSCYHLSNETKTWLESHATCEELNSHLLKIDVREELEILSVFGIEGWISLKMNETNGSWLWEDGTKVVQSLLTFLGRKNYSCAYIGGSYIYNDDCSSKKSYVCELSI
ncbi:killer cell lectin-like receptor subfamily I member 1 [Choloepus didactylus]|uniref:killer cell lectin-like receptor subfamily I member 1 n=1 Tax=Choloepus didactylus TaxID=27675 RepID=UPI00189D567A|nr:killer cell lectin-like receptor subfamily I member 1 [Choloepus didactylus]